MFSKLKAALCAWSAVCFSVLAEPPPFTISLEPDEGGSLVYVPVTASAPGAFRRTLFGLRMTVRNTSSSRVEWTRVRFRFPGRPLLTRTFDRNMAINGGATLTNYLDVDEEAFNLGHSPPSSVMIDFFAEGFADPKTIVRQLAKYEAPAARGAYLFPGREEELGEGVFFDHKIRHSGGSQFYGYDIRAVRWNGVEFTNRNEGFENDLSSNESYVAWGKTVTSMAEGRVIAYEDWWENNPTAGTRAVQKMAATTLPSASLGREAFRFSTREAILLGRGETSAFSRWRLDSTGRHLQEMESHTSGPAVRVSGVTIAPNAFLVGRIGADGEAYLDLWRLNDVTDTMSLVAAESLGFASELVVTNLSSNASVADEKTFITARLNPDGNAEFGIHRADLLNDTLDERRRIASSVASSLSLARLSSNVFAMSSLDESGQIRIRTYEVRELDQPLPLLVNLDSFNSLAGSYDFVKMIRADGDAPAGTIDLVAIQSGIAIVQRYTIGLNASGDITGTDISLMDSVVLGAAQNASLSTGISGGLMVHLQNPESTSQVFLLKWTEDEEDETQGELSIFGEAAVVAAVSDGPGSVVELDTGVHLTTRLAPDLSTVVESYWAAHGGGNHVWLQHGNCAVLYAHLQAGSMPESIKEIGALVRAGQTLGAIGNSGTSTGPHLHIHSARLPTFADFETIVEHVQAEDTACGCSSREAQGEFTENFFIGLRPIPFRCARVASHENLVDGFDSSQLTEMNGETIYYDAYLIRPGWLRNGYVDRTKPASIQSGRRDVVTLGRETFGPFLTVGGAIENGCYAQTLFIRGNSGSYNENLRFDQPAVLRSYDGAAVIGR